MLVIPWFHDHKKSKQKFLPSMIINVRKKSKQRRLFSNKKSFFFIFLYFLFYFFSSIFKKAFLAFFYIQKMAAKYFEKKKTTEMLQRKARENYWNLFEEEKTEKCHQVCKRYRNHFIENELSKEVKSKKHQYARELYKNLSGEKRRENDIKIFLKSFDFLLKYNKEGFFW